MMISFKRGCRGGHVWLRLGEQHHTHSSLASKELFVQEFTADWIIFISKPSYVRLHNIKINTVAFIGSQLFYIYIYIYEGKKYTVTGIL